MSPTSNAPADVTNSIRDVIETYRNGFLELDPDGHIDCAYVNPDFKRRGIMTRLVKHAIEACLARGLNQLIAGLAIALGQVQAEGKLGAEEPEAPAEEPEAEPPPPEDGPDAGEGAETPAEEAPSDPVAEGETAEAETETEEAPSEGEEKEG